MGPRRRAGRCQVTRPRRPARRKAARAAWHVVWRPAAGAACALVLAACASGAAGSAGSGSGVAAAVNNPALDTGSSLGGQPAPDIRLVNQFGQHMALSQFRGKVVILSFVDSECTTVCPLTTVSMLEAKRLLGAAGSQ